jgi:hypothetical protein
MKFFNTYLYYNFTQSLLWYFWIVLHSVTLWTGAWESGSGWGLGVPKLSLCVTCPKTYLLWFWLPPSFPIRSITFPFSLPFLSATLSLWSRVSHRGLQSGFRPRAPISNMYMQETGKMKSPKKRKKHLPREENFEKKKKTHEGCVCVCVGRGGVRGRSCYHGIRPQTSGSSTLGSLRKMLFCLIWAPWCM